MKKILKKAVSAIIAVTLFVSMSICNVFANEEVDIKESVETDIIELDFTSQIVYGTLADSYSITCLGIISNQNTVKITVTATGMINNIKATTQLQKLYGGSWVTINSWADSANAAQNTWEHSVATLSGTYRILITAKSYNGNTLKKTVNFTSGNYNIN